MKKIMPYLILLSLLLTILSGCKSSNNSSQDIFQYKGSYLGNNSDVLGIIHQLPQSKVFNQIILQTQKKPYGMTIKYGYESGSLENNVVNNATFMFTLVNNVDSITFEYPNEKFTLSRQQLQQWYGKDLSEIRTEKDLKKLIQTNLTDKSKVNQLFNE